MNLFPNFENAEVDEHSLFIQLHRAVGQVTAAKEAMWEELCVKLEKDPASLRPYGWDDGDFQMSVSRQKFEALLEQYKK